MKNCHVVRCRLPNFQFVLSKHNTHFVCFSRPVITTNIKANALHDIQISDINLCILLYHDADLMPDGIALHNNAMFTVLQLSIDIINNPKHFALDKLRAICSCNNLTKGAE